MRLSPGSHLGPYEIVGPLGEGGMGAVYKGRDTRLQRSVAIKVPGPEFTDRAEREARAVAALNHPNICTIHDVGEQDGHKFLVMELLEGQTLRERLAGAPLETGQILEWAAQIADAIDAAHRQGIIHRDLKPANIFITARSQVKVLDFGLARRTAPGPDGATATIALDAMSRPGTAAGTIHYMSPEQARGEKLDARSDIFSLGVVLYEMATGRQAFGGSTTAVIFDGILNRNPESPLKLRAGLPLELDRIITKALEKDCKLRYQSAADLVADLERLRRNLTSRSSPAAAPRSRLHMWMVAAAAGAIVASAVFVVNRTASSPGRPAVKFTRITSNPSEIPISNAAISPDGKYLAYSDKAGVHVRHLESAESRVLPDTAGLMAQQFFPDSVRILCREPGVLKQGRAFAVSLLTGTKIALAAGGVPSPDGKWMAEITDGQAIWVQAAGGSDRRKLFDSGRDQFVLDLSWAPDSRRLLYRQWNADTTNALGCVELAGGDHRILLSGRPRFTSPVWLSDGRIIIAQAPPKEPDPGNPLAALYALPTRDGGCAAAGRETPVAEPFEGSVAAISAAAGEAKLAVLRESFQEDVSVAPFEAKGTRLGQIRRLTLDDRNDSPYAWSADSRAVLFVSDRNGDRDIFKQNIESDTAELIAGGPGAQLSPRISPGGEWVLYRDEAPAPSRGKAVHRLMRVPVSGGVREQLLELSGATTVRCPQRGNCLIGDYGFTGTTVSLLDHQSGSKREVFRIPGRPWAFDVLPDGTGAAFVPLEGKFDRIRTLDLNGRTLREVAVKGGHSLLGGLDCAPDGSGFYVGAMDSSSARLLFVDHQGNASVLWQAPVSSRVFAIPSPDGKWLALKTSTAIRNVWLMEGF